jgi:hypothetical protein
MRQALGGMLWTKQHYQFIQKEWLSGDPLQPPPPPERKHIRNKVSEVTSFNDSMVKLATGLATYARGRYPFHAR